MSYEFDGRKYAKASAHQKSWGEKLMADLSLKGDERILDLGCGDGALTTRLAKGVPWGSVLGIDASEGMIEAARSHRRDNLEFRLLDISRIDFREEFDVICSNAALHWVKDHASLLRRVCDALRGGGRARFNFAGDGNCPHFFEVVREVMALPPFADSLAAFEWPWFMPTVEEYRALAAAAPFAKARVWGEKADRQFPDAQAITGWIEQPSLVPFLKHLPEADKQAFRNEVVGRMLKITARPDGTYFEAFRRVNLAARK